jgi:hypothetical protein
MTREEVDWLQKQGGQDPYFEEDEDDKKDDFNQVEFIELLNSNLTT